MNILDQYDYNYPPELIAQQPAHPRDSARLLVYSKKDNAVSYDTFANILKYLPKNSVLVCNQTKVIPARLYVTKENGKTIEMFYIAQEKGLIKVMLNSRVKIGQKVFLTDEIFFTTIKNEENYFFMQPSNSIPSMYQILHKFGNTPIPPYIKHSPLSEKKLRKEYQTIFAKEKGSVAAPTASLHFTKKLLQKIKNAEHDICFVTLHVGLGTFAPVTSENIQKKKLHEEYYTIDAKTAEFLNHAKKQGRPIIAVGTTVVRTLESAVDDSSFITKLSGTTDLFVQEGFQFRFIDGLITNFHVPRSSLMMLVSAFVGREKLLSLYQKSIEKKFRLFSFGDGMLLY